MKWHQAWLLLHSHQDNHHTQECTKLPWTLLTFQASIDMVTRGSSVSHMPACRLRRSSKLTLHLLIHKLTIFRHSSSSRKMPSGLFFCISGPTWFLRIFPTVKLLQMRFTPSPCGWKDCCENNSRTLRALSHLPLMPARLRHLTHISPSPDIGSMLTGSFTTKYLHSLRSRDHILVQTLGNFSWIHSRTMAYYIWTR